MATQIKPAPVIITAAPGDPLASWHAEYQVRKALADAANAQLDAIKDRLKTELRTLHPDAQVIELQTPGTDLVPVRVSHSEPIRIDGPAMRKADPLLYATYARKGDQWELRQVAS